MFRNKLLTEFFTSRNGIYRLSLFMDVSDDRLKLATLRLHNLTRLDLLKNHFSLAWNGVFCPKNPEFRTMSLVSLF